jgi:hypothetical protein
MRGGEPWVMSYCWRIYFKVLAVLFLGEVSLAFLPVKKAWWTHKLRHLRVGRQYPTICHDIGRLFSYHSKTFSTRIFQKLLLVNEAIIDVAIGASQFRGEYTGGMPMLGCPGCNGETMAYIEPEI